ncbi:MAG: flagellar FlbD family protein [Chloroflexota bacterium]|nr:flagellar FlbD family protein [Dehalococcoidia bacterium]MDW8047618.1 flagellar FlbD family protein [Chloroflexota bacterium]
MVELTRIDGTRFYLNSDLIEVIEANHDTHITLTNGHRYICSEPPEVIVERIAEFRRRSTGFVVRRAS